MEIIKVVKESFAPLRFLGIRYTDADREGGNFSAKWREWFESGRFDFLVSEQPSCMDYLGMMRVHNGEFEYWIGMFFPRSEEVHEGYQHVDIDGLDVATCRLYGKPDSLLGLEAHNRCIEEMEKQGLVRKDNDWCIERYNMPLFTTPDDKGNVILDYCISIEK